MLKIRVRWPTFQSVEDQARLSFKNLCYEHLNIKPFTEDFTLDNKMKKFKFKLNEFINSYVKVSDNTIKNCWNHTKLVNILDTASEDNGVQDSSIENDISDLHLLNPMRQYINYAEGVKKIFSMKKKIKRKIAKKLMIRLKN
jgi:hypothetical protein